MAIGVSTTGETYEDEFEYYVQSMQTAEGLPFLQLQEPNLDDVGPTDRLKRKREQQDDFDAGVIRTLRPGKEVPDALPGMIINPRDMNLMKEQYKEQGASISPGPFDFAKYATDTDFSSQSAPETLTDKVRSKFGSPPPAARFFLETLFGSREKITEKDFTEEELEILRESAERRFSKPPGTGDEEGYYLGYGDYSEGGEINFTDFGGGTKNFLQALTDLPSSLSFTLGMAKLSKEDNGTIVINDKYDFAASEKKVKELKDKGSLEILKMLAEGMSHNGLLGIGNVIGNLVAPADTGREIEIRIPPKDTDFSSLSVIQEANPMKDQSRFESVDAPTYDPFEAAAARVRAKHPTRADPNAPEWTWDLVAKYGQYKFKQALDRAKNVITAPDRARRGELDPMSPEAIGLMVDLAGTMVFGPAPIAGKVANGTLGSFGGIKAETLHPQDFVDARKMDLKGHSNQEIWEKTGMWKGNDGIWRHEIPGTPELTQGVWPKKGKLPDYYKHDELYKAYPELKNVNIDTTYKKGLGQFNTETNTIHLNLDGIADRNYPVIMTLTHEIQHWIQRHEGFITQGTNVDAAGLKVLSALKDKTLAFAKAGDKEGIKIINDLLDDIEKNPKRFWKYMYFRDPGEVEANLASHRDYAMTPEQKFKESPMATQKRLEEQHNVASEFRYPADRPELNSMPEMIKFDKFDTYTRNGVEHYGLEFNKIYKLENILDNKDLYKQHPELRKIKVVRAADENYSFFDAEKNTLHIGTMNSEKLYEALADVVSRKTSVNPAQAGPFDAPLEHRLKGTGVSHPGYVWDVVDKQTGKVVGTYNNSRRATTRVDKLDNEYGAYRYRKVMRKVEE